MFIILVLQDHQFTENRLISEILENIYFLTGYKLYKNKNFKILFKIDRLNKKKIKKI